MRLAESAIATRLDLSHPEKVEQIRPLREKRRAASEAAQERYGLQYDREYREQEESRIAAAVTETMAVSDEDRDWARELRIKLD